MVPPADFQFFMQSVRQSHVRPVKLLPENVLKKCAIEYLHLMHAVVDDPLNLHAWLYMFLFVKCVWRQLPAGSNGKFHFKEQANYINSNLTRWRDGPQGRRSLFDEIHGYKRPVRNSGPVQSELNVRRAKQLLERGRLSSSMQALNSCGIKAIDANVLDELKAKHPYAPPPERSAVPLPPAVKVEVDLVLKALRSFPSDTAGGADGLRPAHMYALLHAVPGSHYDMFLRNCTAIINLLLEAKVPPELAQFVCSAPIIPLRKPDDGVRPIAVGEVWRRWAAKCAMSSVSQKMANYFCPIQMGVGIRDGAVATVHAAQSLIREYQSDRSLVLLKIDFANAFNTISRNYMLQAVRQHCPEIYTWVQFCYSDHSQLYVDGYDIITSASGVQQGDPLGPLLFALTLHEIVFPLSRDFPELKLFSWYLDDGVIIGEIAMVQRVLAELCPWLSVGRCPICYKVGKQTSGSD